MGQVPGFWVGARRWARPGDLAVLAARLGGPDRVSAATERDLAAIGVPPGRAAAWAGAGAEPSDGEVLAWSDARYPPALRETPDAPPVLCVQGDLAALDGPAVAIVGTRACTPYGIAVARALAAALAERGVSVVSGLARGIDTHAHDAAAARGRTVAVLGHGLGTTAPASNRHLRSRISGGRGLVVSAFPDELGPARWTFPLRNKVVAGLVSAVVVVEAPAHSGALITAAEAAAIGREVWAVPAALGVASSAGCLALLAAGASIVDDVASFADRYGAGQPTLDDPVVLALHDAPTAEEIARRTGLTLAAALARLSALEIRGRVRRLPGARYGRA